MPGDVAIVAALAVNRDKDDCKPNPSSMPVVQTTHLVGQQPAAMEMLSFMFNGRPVRLKLINDEPWWVAKDVAEALGYSVQGGIGKYINHVPEEWRGGTPISTPSGDQNMAVLSEPGLNFFVVRSNKPAAVPFQKWIAGDVIPAIRKTGMFQVTPKVPLTLQDALRAYAQALDEKVALSCRVAEMDLMVNNSGSHVVRGLSVHEFAQHLFKGLSVAENTARNRLYRWLRGAGYLIPGTCKPFQQWIDAGLFCSGPSLSP